VQRLPQLVSPRELPARALRHERLERGGVPARAAAVPAHLDRVRIRVRAS
jgi:hypothetical protein